MESSWYEMRVPGRNTVYYVTCNERTFSRGLPEGVTFSPIDRKTYERRVEAEQARFILEYSNPLFFLNFN